MNDNSSYNVILFSNNSLIDEIKKGIDKNNFTVVENREEAIAKSLSGNDSIIILIVGKGYEDYQEIKGVRKHSSDKETAKKYLKT